MESKIFRKNSLDRLSNPEQLDQLVQVTSPKGWITFLVILAILGAVLGWSVLGSIETTITCSGIILPEDGLHQIYSTEAGIVSKIFVSKGERIKPGQVIATIKPLKATDEGRQQLSQQSIEVAEIQRKIQSLQSKLEARPRYFDMGFIAQKERQNLEETLLKTKADLNEALQKDNQQRQRRQGQEIEIYATGEGRVIFVEVTEGAFMEQAKPVLTFSSEKPTRVFAFIPFSAAETQEGMKTQIFPVTVRKEDYGGILGRIKNVSDFPSRPTMLYGLLKNQLLVEQFTKNGDPYMVQIEMDRNPKNFSTYEWSTPHGPPQKIQDGTVCSVRIVLRKDRPLTFIVPAARRFFE